MVDSRLLAQVVDDDPAIVRFVRRNLELEEFRVIVASDGATAGTPRYDTPSLRPSPRAKGQSGSPILCMTSKYYIPQYKKQTSSL